MPALIENGATTGRPIRGERQPLPDKGPDQVARTPPEAALYLETARDSDEWAIAPEVLDWSAIEMRLDGEDSKATIVVRALDAKQLTAGGNLGRQHLTHLLTLLHPDKRIRIAMAQGADPPVILFQGYPQTRQASWSDRHQAITVSCIFEAQEIMRTNSFTQIMGRRRRINPLRPQSDDLTLDLVTVLAQGAVFNPDNKPNRLATSLAFEGDEFYVFDDDEAKDAKAWSFADALRYVVILHAAFESLGVSVADFTWDTIDLVGKPPAPNSADPFVRNMLNRVNAVSIASMNVDSALAALCHAADLHFHYEIRVPDSDDPSNVKPEYHLRIFATLKDENAEGATPSPDRRMVSPKVHDITRDAPFMDYTGLTPADIAGRNEARKADLSQDTRAVNAPIFLGGAWEYQVTVLMRPGWMPHLNVDKWVPEPPLPPEPELPPTNAQIEKAIGYWEEAFGFDDTVGEAERDPQTGEFLRWASIYHRKHPDFKTVADVWRRWVFPDDFAYMGADLESSPYKRAFGPWSTWEWFSPDLGFGGPPSSTWMDGQFGGSISDALNWAPRPRPFGDTIGRMNLLTTARDPIVWINFFPPPAVFEPATALASPGWMRYGGAVDFDKQRAAIWLAEDNLWASAALREDPLVGDSNMIEAYLNDSFALAVTATVIGDGRLQRRPNPTGSTLTRKRMAIVDLGYERFQFRNRIERDGFRLFEPDPDPKFQTRDDVADFNRFADETAKVLASDVVAGSVTVPYIKTDVRLGDSFSGCDGMGIHFQSYPEVVCIEYVKDPKAGYQTVYHLTDLRHAPEVGSE